MLRVSFACCVAVVALFAWLHRLYGGWSAILYVPVAFVLTFVAPAAFLTALLLAVIGVFMPKTARERTHWFAGGIIIVAMFGFVLWDTQDEINELHELRAEYPITSLSDRLAYEANSPRYVPAPGGSSPQQDPPTTSAGSDISKPVAVTPTPLTLSPKVADNLTKLDSTLKWAGESFLFEQLHSVQYESFVRANGFGAMRMPRVNRRWIEHELKEPEPIPQAVPSSELLEFAESPADLEPADLDPENAQPPPGPFLTGDSAMTSLDRLHRDGRNEFFDKDRFGFIASRQRAAGFQPHAFHEATRPHAPEFQQSLQIARLELVSLLKFPTPRVYVSDYLPDMEQLQDVPTRELDAFESAALTKLWTEEDIIVEEHPGEIRMLGSLRAGTQCLKCHSVQRGDLLGAFSYRIHTPGHRPRKLLPEERKTALRLDREPRSHVAIASMDRY